VAAINKVNSVWTLFVRRNHHTYNPRQWTLEHIPNVTSDQHLRATSMTYRKIPDCKLVKKKFFFYLMVAYIYSTQVLVRPTDKMSLLAYLPPSDRYE